MAKAYGIVKTAVGEIGVKESPKNSNKQKYGVAYGRNGISWCCIFVWWVFMKNNASDLFYGGGKTTSCTTLMNYYRKNGQIIKRGYKPGDIVFFDWDKSGDADHVGIIERVSGNTIYTIEGNTSVGNDSNGGEVMRRTRSVNSSSYNITVARPKYEAETEEIKVNITLTQLSNGGKGEQVKTLQRLLNALGYSCGKADGDFGKNTLAAVKKFQSAKKLTADGIVGQNTWNRLLKG